MDHSTGGSYKDQFGRFNNTSTSTDIIGFGVRISSSYKPKSEENND